MRKSNLKYYIFEFHIYKFMEKHFIFGYGSLINETSRHRSSPSAFEAIPVKIKNYTRGWFARTGIKGLSTTFLGCLRNDSEILLADEKLPFVNGVIYEVDKNELPILDKREKRYSRTKVERSDIIPYEGKPKYFLKKTQPSMYTL